MQVNRQHSAEGERQYATLPHRTEVEYSLRYTVAMVPCREDDREF